MKRTMQNRKRKLLPVMLAVALAAVMLAPMGSSTALAEEGADSYSLTVNANEQYIKEDSQLKETKLQIYKVVDLNEGTAESSWSLTEQFAAADKDGALGKLLDEVSTTYCTNADEAAKLKQKYQQIESRATHCIVESKMPATATSTFGTKQSLSDKGIYLVIPVRGDEIKSDGAGKAMVETDTYKYSFLPMLLFVPGVDPAEVDEGEWAYGYGDIANVVINAKQSRESVSQPPEKTVKKTVTNTHKVKTGDEFPVLPILVAVVAVILLVLIRRRGESESR